MRFWFTVKINKTVVLERDGEDADEARSKINFASINLADFDWSRRLPDHRDRAGRLVPRE